MVVGVPPCALGLSPLRVFFGALLAPRLTVCFEGDSLLSVLLFFFFFFIGISEPRGVGDGIPALEALDLGHGLGINPLLFVVVDEVPRQWDFRFRARGESAEDEPLDMGFPFFLVA